MSLTIFTNYSLHTVESLQKLISQSSIILCTYPSQATVSLMRKSSLLSYPPIFRNCSLNSFINQYLLFLWRELDFSDEGCATDALLFHVYCQTQLQILNSCPCFHEEASLTVPEETIALPPQTHQGFDQGGCLGLQH